MLHRYGRTGLAQLVENPFFGAMQEIAANKAKELGYTTLRLNHGDDANKQMELFEIGHPGCDPGR